MPKIFLKSNARSITCLEKETLFLINLVDIYYMKRKSEKQNENLSKSKQERENYSLISIFAIAFYQHPVKRWFHSKATWSKMQGVNNGEKWDFKAFSCLEDMQKIIEK